jgi:hypothetical protein
VSWGSRKAGGALTSRFACFGHGYARVVWVRRAFCLGVFVGNRLLEERLCLFSVLLIRGFINVFF